MVQHVAQLLGRHGRDYHARVRIPQVAQRGVVVQAQVLGRRGDLVLADGVDDVLDRLHEAAHLLDLGERMYRSLDCWMLGPSVSTSISMSPIISR